jgi:catechol 2,3-dioxygenase-like lactoylglutathione lyase family enzyme
VTDIRLDHVVIAVSDWDRSTDFYRAVVGAEVIDRGAGRVCFRIGETQLNVHGPGFYPKANVARLPVRPGNSDICFRWDGPRKLLLTFDDTASKWRRVRCRDSELVATEPASTSATQTAACFSSFPTPLGMSFGDKRRGDLNGRRQ